MTILKADPENRRRAVYIIGVMTIAGIIAIQWGLPGLEALLDALPLKDAILVVNIVLSIPFLVLIPCALYFYRFGWKVLHSNQFPPPGTKVLRDTVVRTGLAARRRGIMLVAAGVLFMVAGLFGAAYFPYSFSKMLNKQIACERSGEGESRVPQTSRPR